MSFLVECQVPVEEYLELAWFVAGALEQLAPLKPVSVDMLICADKVGQSARESTREMNVASLCFLPATEGAEVLAFSFFSSSS